MNLNKFNEVLKEARINAKMTQSELAKGICTQAQISKLEKGDEFPSSITLYLISKKLGVDAEYFFRQIESTRVDYIDEVKSIAKKYKREKAYYKLNELIDDQLKTPLARESIDFYQFLLWHKGISIYYIKQDKLIAIKLLTKALKMKHKNLNKEREIEILNSIGIILYDDKNFQLSLKVFESAITKVNQKPVLKDFTIPLRLLYGASKSSLALEKVSSSLNFCEKGISVCKDYETLFLLGELYYQKARCLKRLKDLKADIFFEKAINTFLLQDNTDYAEIVEEAYQDYQEELKEGV
ncbi:helix-turn-helix domain-containing protein [Piscibacillus sp. B03]|uniref:helix-turn-helix domain-containing protein n=1 Tax=Piscibacillus sp. B03 TaxID=3457430 RepID=UPI003FCD58B9